MSVHDLSWDHAGYRIAQQELKSRKFYTPDIRDVEKYDNHLVFVDSYLMSKYNTKREFLEKAQYLGAAMTVSGQYRMMCSNRWAVTFHEAKKPTSRNVFGEVYAVSTEALFALDAFYSNYLYVNRKKQWVRLREQEAPFKNGITRPTVEAWMYLGIPERWKDITLVYGPVALDKGIQTYHWNDKPKIID